MEFIVVHVKGKERFVNTKWIEEIQEEGGGTCTIYLAFTCPYSIDQDYIKPDESYQEVKMMIWR